jgi:hypothetical protein
MKKSIWTTITGGLTSAAPILLSCCKSGACIGVCASPIASLFGVSSAAIASSPLVNALEPLLIAISAVSFTISYYSLYVIPKLNCNTGATCDCVPDEKAKRKTKINKSIFWTGLILSIVFLSYFEFSKYQASTNQPSCTQSECGTPKTTDCSNGCSDSSSCSDSTSEEQ